MSYVRFGEAPESTMAAARAHAAALKLPIRTDDGTRQAKGLDVGYRTAQIQVNARISSNNDERDVADRAAWAKFQKAVRELARQPEYAELDIDVDDRGTIS